MESLSAEGGAFEVSSGDTAAKPATAKHFSWDAQTFSNVSRHPGRSRQVDLATRLRLELKARMPAGPSLLWRPPELESWVE